MTQSPLPTLRPRVDTVTVDLTIDTSGWDRAVRDLTASLKRAGATAVKAAERLGWALERWASQYDRQRREVTISGLEARWYVRGGLEYRTEEELTEAVLRTWRDRFLLDLTQAEARRLMVAAMVGYAQHARQELACLDCDGTGEVPVGVQRMTLWVCQTCDGSGEWDPDQRRGTTETITWRGYFQALRLSSQARSAG